MVKEVRWKKMNEQVGNEAYNKAWHQFNDKVGETLEKLFTEAKDNHTDLLRDFPKGTHYVSKIAANSVDTIHDGVLYELRMETTFKYVPILKIDD